MGGACCFDDAEDVGSLASKSLIEKLLTVLVFVC